jgi:hypothetical protein
MQTHDAEHLAGRFLDRDEGHRPRIVDLGEARDERMRERIDGREESQAQILRRDGGEERAVQWLALRPYRAYQQRRAVAKPDVALPRLRIGSDGVVTFWNLGRAK